ncbi:MAG: aldo/keto reductase [Rhodospirillaceae bacterium]|nr:aldo/keto reductase [Rhodospirillaceae bacterium]
METRSLGKSGLRVSAVGVGCNNFGMGIDEAGTKAVVNKALDLGITLFDTADVYGGSGNSEIFLGKALGTKRKDIVLATKFGMKMGEGWQLRGGGSRDYIMRAVEASLRRLGTDYIDLYQIHQPDTGTPVEETMRALDDVVRQGKVRYIGHSNFAGWQTADAAWTARTRNLTAFVSAQNRYSLLTRDIEKELVPACENHGVSILPYFPLESGLLTGKYKHGQKPTEGTRWSTWSQFAPGYAAQFFSDEKFAQVGKLQSLCDKYGHTMLDMAVGWLLSKGYVASVIAGATRPEQLEQNVKAAAWRPGAEEAGKIDEITALPKSLF